MLKIRTYSDDEYYTTEETALNFFEKVVNPSEILKHKTLMMPFSNLECPLYKTALKYHDNVVCFKDDENLWRKVSDYEDAAVVDNPPFSMSKKIETKYIEEEIPFILFRSAVSYPKFIFKKTKAGVVYENSAKGVEFQWGIEKHIQGDEYIKINYPNLTDNLKSIGALEKAVPVGFSFFNTNYRFKTKSVTFSEYSYPEKKDQYIYLNQGVYDENTEIYEDEKDGRIHLISK